MQYLPLALLTLHLGLDDAGSLAQVPSPLFQPLFVSGEGGYHTYRIPALHATSSGTLLAFCEGRVHDSSDSGDIDLVLRRSMDGGQTWLDRQVVWDDGPNTVGNPCVVEDEATGTLWLLLTHNLGEDREHEIIAGTSRGTRTVWITRSLDEGESWDTPREITADTKLPAWTWYATGPGVGIRLRQEPFRGRLVIPCDHDGPDGYRSHVIYSDDGGASWTLGGATEPGTNECQVVERSDGTLLLNMRTHGGILQTNQRMVAISRDGGESWDPISEDPGLPEPHCQGSLIRVMASDSGDRRLLFANPASTEDRVAMTVRLSEDDGGTWAASYLVHPGPSAYSCLASLPDGSIGLLFEKGDRHPYETITFVRLTTQPVNGGS